MRTPMRNHDLTPPGPLPIGEIRQHGNLYRAECHQCTWSNRARRRDDAASRLRSHHRIAHPPRELIYQETP